MMSDDKNRNIEPKKQIIDNKKRNIESKKLLIGEKKGNIEPKKRVIGEKKCSSAFTIPFLERKNQIIELNNLILLVEKMIIEADNRNMVVKKSELYITISI